MVRRASHLGLAVALLAAAAGCRSSCGDRRGWFVSRDPCEPPCQLVGRHHGGVPVDAGVSYPVGVVPGGTTVIPGGPAGVPGGGPPADVLPYPQPSGLIPPPGVPAIPPATPSPAPAPDATGVGGFRTGQPIRGSIK